MKVIGLFVVLMMILGFGTVSSRAEEERASEGTHGAEEEAHDGDHEDHEGHPPSSADSGEACEEHKDEEEHGDHEEHEDEADHAGHDHSAHADEGDGLRLTAEQRDRFGIVLATAEAGSLRNEARLSGQVVFNEDRVVHVVPRVAGITRQVMKRLGDSVEPGEQLAVIDSRELAVAKSEYLAARGRVGLAENQFAREKSLHEKKVSAEQDYLEAEKTLAEARIELRSAEQQLCALGLTEAAVADINAGHAETFTRYEIRSPIKGVVTEKHIVAGESLDGDTGIFTLADLSQVWVNLTVYTKDLALLHKGQDVVLRADHSGAQARGTIAMVTPFVDKATRSATARVVLDNSDGRWIPGTFVSGFVSTAEENLPVVVSREAVQSIEGEDVVFIEQEGAFETALVTVGRSDRTNVEIVAGLKPGQRYIVKGAFQLKATLVTSDLDPHAGHGH